MGLEGVSLVLPGSELVIRIHAGGLVDPAELDTAAILVGPSPRGARPTVTFDATKLAEVFGAKAHAIEAMLTSLEPAVIAPELARLVGAGQLPAECAPILARAEAALVEGDPLAPAALALVYVHTRIANLAT